MRRCGCSFKVVKSMGYDDYLIAQLYWFLRDYQRNSFGVGAPTDAVLEVGGSPPEDFEQIARRYVAASRFARRTIGSRLAAALRLLKALVTPAPDIGRIARRLALPTISHAMLAADSDGWRRTHERAIDAPGPRRVEHPPSRSWNPDARR